MSRFCLHSRLSVYYRVYSVKIMKIPKQDTVLDPWYCDEDVVNSETTVGVTGLSP